MPLAQLPTVSLVSHGVAEALPSLPLSSTILFPGVSFFWSSEGTSHGGLTKDICKDHFQMRSRAAAPGH